LLVQRKAIHITVAFGNRRNNLAANALQKAVF